MSWNNVGPSTLKKSARWISAFPPDVEPISFKTYSRYRQNLIKRRGRYLTDNRVLLGFTKNGFDSFSPDYGDVTVISVCHPLIGSN